MHLQKLLHEYPPCFPRDFYGEKNLQKNVDTEAKGLLVG